MRKPIRVLIVDDQPRARKSLKALLSTSPCVGEMYEAGDGREAVQLAKDLQPDIVLMDVRMPQLDGLKATAEIKALWPEMRVVALSMYAEYCQEALAAGADAFVAKADAPGALVCTLAAMMKDA
jgi:NarL family two-component system response regulator LiaR